MGPGGDEGEDYIGGSGGYSSSMWALIRHLVMERPHIFLQDRNKYSAATLGRNNDLSICQDFFHIYKYL